MALEMLEAQVVQVVLPDGDKESRLASVDATSSSLILKQVALSPSAEVQVGGQAVVKLSSIGHAKATGKIVYLRAGGPTGPILLELHFDSASVAKLWARALSPGGYTEASPAASPARSPASAGRGVRGSPTGGQAKMVSSSGQSSPASRASPTSQGRGTSGAAPTAEEEAADAATTTLYELVRQQEEQVRLLQEITSRKDEQLLKIQEKVEESLTMLQGGQEQYAQQGKLVAKQNEMIAMLRSQLEGADSIAAACNANAAEAAAGWAAARAARSQAAGSNAMARAQAAAPRSAGSSPGATAGAQARAAAAFAAVQQARASATAAPAAGRFKTVQQESEDDDDGGAQYEAVSEEQEAILAKIRALDAAKGAHEAELMQEQHKIFSELKELQNMMAELGLDLNDVTAAQA